MKQNQR